MLRPVMQGGRSASRLFYLAHTPITPCAQQLPHLVEQTGALLILAGAYAAQFVGQAQLQA